MIDLVLLELLDEFGHLGAGPPFVGRWCVDQNFADLLETDVEPVCFDQQPVRLYLGRGFQPVAEPLAELFELEPEDVHMRKVL